MYYTLFCCILVVFFCNSSSNRGSNVNSYSIKTTSIRSIGTSLSWSNVLTDLDTNIDTNTKTSINTIKNIPAVDITVKQASFFDLSNIVNLRMNVFFPKFQTDVSFYQSILDKIRTRHVNGAVIFMAINNDMNDPIMKLKGNIIGTIEVSGTDFIGTTMQSMGADSKLYVTDLAVRNDMRRLGVATSLLKAVEQYAKNNMFKEIYLHVEVDNESAKNLYLTNGYNIVPLYECVENFAKLRLVKPAECYVMLSKQIS